MTINKKVTGRALSIPAGLAVGNLVSIGMTLLIALILANLIKNETLQEDCVGYGIMILLLAASFSGALTAYGTIKRQRLLICLLSGSVYFGMLLLCTALFFGGQYEAVGVTAALILGGSGTAGLIGLHEKRGGNYRNRRKYTR